MNPWGVLTGHRQDGRSEALREAVSRLQAAGLEVGGFVQEPVVRAGETVGWDAVALRDGSRCALARPSATPELCNWAFSSTALGRCRDWVLAPRAQVVVVELGRLEAQGRGHWSALMQLLQGPPRGALLSIRRSPLAAIALQLPDPVAGLELPAQPGALEAVCHEIQAAARALSPAPVDG